MHFYVPGHTQGEEPTKAPPLPDLRGQVAVGVRAAVREIAVRFVRRIYEHLAVWQLGTARAAPFLRDGVLWVHHVSAATHDPAPFPCFAAADPEPLECSS